MKALPALMAAIALLAAPAFAQPQRTERSVERQREAVEAWTRCIADENVEEVAALLVRDFRTEDYKADIEALGKKRVSSECFNAMPRNYRRIQLGGLPFAGGLAERMLKRDEEPLLTRLSMAAIGDAPDTWSRTDGIAMCMVRGAPHLVAILFDSEINSGEEIEALAQLQPVADACTRGAAKLEATPLGMRSMLATASFRLLAAQKDDDDA